MHTALFMVLLSNGTGAEDPPVKTQPDPTVEKARGLSRAAFRQYLQKLASEKKFKELRAILKSDLPNAGWAAFELADAYEPEQAIEFCESLSLGSSDWAYALGGLAQHPKDKVIGYIMRKANSSDAKVRACCYRICGVKGWDDLVPLAKRDLGDSTPVFFPGQAELCTLGKEAKNYIDRVSTRKP
jgi:hypothetical protein